jgi:hypothetical protein
MSYPLPWYDDRDKFSEPPGDTWRFTAQDYTLAYALDVPTNYEAEALVRDALTAAHPEVAARVTFDSEAGCFFAYTDTVADMEVLVAVVAELVDGHHPDAVPGGIFDSPAAIRPWDSLLSGPAGSPVATAEPVSSDQHHFAQHMVDKLCDAVTAVTARRVELADLLAPAPAPDDGQRLASYFDDLAARLAEMDGDEFDDSAVAVGLSTVLDASMWSTAAQVLRTRLG